MSALDVSLAVELGVIAAAMAEGGRQSLSKDDCCNTGADEITVGGRKGIGTGYICWLQGSRVDF